jgi:hypothetical protein
MRERLGTAVQSGWFWTALWATFLLIHTAYMGAFAGEIDLVDVLLLGGAGVSVACVTLIVLARGDREPEVEAVADLSLATVIAAIGLAGLLIGFELGTWLIAIGGGLLVAGLGTLWRERTGRAA